MRRCIVLEKESALGAGGGVERVALIKSLIYVKRKNALRAQGCQSSAENVSRYLVDPIII